MIKLFEILNGVIVPTEHCYTLRVMKQIMEDYPDDYLSIYAYVFYMSCPNPELNPFFNVRESDKEEMILEQLNPAFSTEDEAIIDAVLFSKSLYETPSFRAYMGLKSMLDRLASYMETTDIVHGRDGNINSLVNAAAKFETIRIGFKGAYKDLMEEQKSSVRGGENLAYDQK